MAFAAYSVKAGKIRFLSASLKKSAEPYIPFFKRKIFPLFDQRDRIIFKCPLVAPANTRSSAVKTGSIFIFFQIISVRLFFISFLIIYINCILSEIICQYLLFIFPYAQQL